MKNKLLFIFLFAFFIRLFALNQSLWLDEATTARVVKEYGFTQIINEFSIKDFHPPFYYLFMKGWTNVFGYSEIALRMPSVLFSLATGYVVYFIGGIWASIFFLFNPLIVYYSQEARMYMMATFFLTTALYFFISNLPPSSRLRWASKNQILFLIFSALAILTFYGSIFLIGSMVLYYLFSKRFKYFILNTLYLILLLFLLSPLLYQQLINAKISLASVANWSYVLGKTNLKNLLLIPVKFSIGRIDFYPKWAYYLIAGGWTIFVIKQILNLNDKIQFKSKIQITKILLFLLICPSIFGFLISFVTPLLQYFRFIYLIPIMAILLSFSLSIKADIQPPGLTRLVLMGGYLVFSFVYLLMPRFHREDWKSLVKSLQKDKPVYMISSSSDPVKYYNSKLIINELASLRVNELTKQIIIIPYTADIHGVDYRNNLIINKYKLTEKKSFRGLELERWILK